jgi:recombination protein RecA
MAGGGGSPHPRSEGRGLSTAISSFLESELPVSNLPPRRRDKSLGTPGVANRSIAAEQATQRKSAGQPARTEQVATDRLPARRGAYVLDQRARAQGQVEADQQSYAPRCAEPQPRRLPQLIAAQPSARLLPITLAPHIPRITMRDPKPWKRLDQALRATDLLLQTGGFAALVLDLGTIAPAEVSRIPLATWFRFRAAADRTRTTIILLTQHPCAQTSAELVLRTAVQLPDAGTVLAGLAYSVELVRQRFQPANPTTQPQRVLTLRKPPQRATSTTWQAACYWTGGR